MEPEDAILCRDLKPLVDMLNNQARTIAADAAYAGWLNSVSRIRSDT
jgi:hypothetical protein